MQQQPEVFGGKDGISLRTIAARIDVLSFVLAVWVVLLTCSAYRHAVFRSTAFDLGIFDQALWQLSQDTEPYSSLMRMNIFSDHGAFILYPLSFLYRLYASPYVLLALQSLSLALGIIPLVALTRYYGIPDRFHLVGAVTYALHPVVFNTSLFDFHPETIGVPLLSLVVLWSEQRRYLWAAAAALLIISCKEVLALTVAALGVCLWLKKHRLFGAVLSGVAVAWFVFVTTYVMPNLPYGATPNSFLRYSFLGESFADKIQTILFRPLVVLQNLHLPQSVSYLCLLLLPCVWCLSRRSVVYAIALIPLVVLNALSSLDFQRSLRLQYSLPLIPILSLMVIESLRQFSARLSGFSAKKLIGWSILCSLAPPIIGNIRNYGEYPVMWAPVGDVAEFTGAIRSVPPHASVLASSRLVPHLSHRQLIRVIDSNEHRAVESAPEMLGEYEYVVVDKTRVLDANERKANADILLAVAKSGRYRIFFEGQCVAVFART